MAVLTNIPNNTSARDWRDTMNALIKRIAALEAAGVPVETPAPAFTTQPSISPTSGTAGSTVYAATPGTVSNGSVVSRAWLLNGTAISTGVTAVPASAGTLTYQETASGPGGTTTSTVQVAAVTAATVTPTPAPSFTSQPSISPNTGTAGTTTFTATAGNVSNGSITARSWTINGTVISTGITAAPASSGTLTYQETATGSGGTTQSTVQQVTVATAAAAAPAFTSQPTVSPSTGTAGATTYTATPGAVSSGTITSRAWALNGSTISTGLTAAPTSAGTLTYQEFATGNGGGAQSTVQQATVAAAAVTPAPSFTTQPTVSPSSGASGATFTATPGTVANGTIASRVWSLNGTVISTALTAVPASAGTLTYRETASGSNGTTQSTVVSVAVSAASTLTLSPTSPSIASNAVAGTLVSNISNVPTGATPTVTPNDGRLVIAGSASAGWKVVVGMSAPSAGQVNFTVAASGATSAAGVLTVRDPNVTLPHRLNTFGDSITNNVGSPGLSHESLSWANRLGVYKGVTRINNGISGTVLQNSNDLTGAPRTDNGVDRHVAALLTGYNLSSNYVIAYGLNDLRYTHDTGTTDFTLANFIADYRTVLNNLIAAGVQPVNICIASPYWIPDAGYTTGSTGFTGGSRAYHEQYVAACAALATEFGTTYRDLYAYMRDNGGASLVGPDNIHPNEAGHLAIFDCLKTIPFTSALTPAAPVTLAARTAELVGPDGSNKWTSNTGGTSFNGIGQLNGTATVGVEEFWIEGVYDSDTTAGLNFAFGPDAGAGATNTNMYLAFVQPGGSTFRAYNGVTSTTANYIVTVGEKFRLRCALDGTVSMDTSIDGVTWIKRYVFGTKATGTLYGRFYTREDRISTDVKQRSFVGEATVVLNPLTLSPTTATVGTAYTGTVSGKTPGSALALSGTGAAGLTVSGSTLSGTVTTAGPVNIIETLSGATFSPRTSSGALTVSAAASATPVTLAARTAELVGPDGSNNWTSTTGTTFSGIGQLVGTATVGAGEFWIEGVYDNDTTAGLNFAIGPNAGTGATNTNMYLVFVQPGGNTYRAYNGATSTTASYIVTVGDKFRLYCALDGTVSMDTSIDGVTWIKRYTFSTKATGTFYGRFYTRADRVSTNVKQRNFA